MREWVLYVGIMAVILYIFFRDQGFVGAAAGLLISGPLYLAIGYVLAKLGYTRKTLKEMRTPRADTASKRSSDEGGSTATSERPKPPPTRRTSTGANRPKRKRR